MARYVPIAQYDAPIATTQAVLPSHSVACRSLLPAQLLVKRTRRACWADTEPARVTPIPAMVAYAAPAVSAATEAMRAAFPSNA